MLCVLVLLASSLASIARADGGDLVLRVEDMLGGEGLIWETAPEDFMQSYARAGFRWSSPNKDLARAYRKSITFLDMPASDINASFGDGTLKQLTILLYDRGDAGELSKENFQDLLRRVQSSINRWTGALPRRLDDQLKTDGVKRDSKAWAYGPHDIRLVWSYSTKDETGRFAFRSEYIRVECVPQEQNNGGAAPLISRTSSKNMTVSAGEMKSAVTRTPNGDVYIEGIPMIDQGEKGYCAVATAERVMRQFGFDVDQHEMAQLAASSAEEGTNPEAMIRVLKRVGVKLGCSIKTLESFDINGFVKLVDRYNRQARKEKLPEIQLDQMIVISEVYSRMEPSILRDVRRRSQSDFKKFEKNIADYIDQGNPLAWSVVLGIIPETPAISSFGGHMRLIIGYNSLQNELIYSDSWGRGHEFKRMAMEDAWTITTGLYSIEPRWKSR